jgi:hypothetical protein
MERPRSEGVIVQARQPSALKLAAVPGDRGAEPGDLRDDGVRDPAGATEVEGTVAAEVLLLQFGIGREECALSSREAGIQGVQDGEFWCGEQLVGGRHQVTHAAFSTS